MGFRARTLIRWIAWMVGAVAALLALYMSVFFAPYPLFPHHTEHAGFSVYSDREIPDDLAPVLEDAYRRVAAMELYDAGGLPRIFICRSQRLFVALNRLAGKRHTGQGLLISAAGNTFLSVDGIQSVARRSENRPQHSRLQGSWSAAIAHEVAHYLVFRKLGSRSARALPVWKSEGWADYAANKAPIQADPGYQPRSRVRHLLDETAWQYPSGSIDRRHFRWQLLVEHLCAVEGLDFSGLMDPSVTEDEAWDRMLSWYQTPRVEGPAPTILPAGPISKLEPARLQARGSPADSDSLLRMVS